VRAVIQRASTASVTVAGETVGQLAAPGLLVLVGVTHTDTPQDAGALARKIYYLRILAGEKSCADLGAPLLVVSQFTLYADTTRGRRPSFVQAAPPPLARALVDRVVSQLGAAGARVATGRFGAMMQVRLVNEGPVTVMLET
jgi:D-tyrosyl-tRNA(Tyr) deacylase